MKKTNWIIWIISITMIVFLSWAILVNVTLSMLLREPKVGAKQQIVDTLNMDDITIESRCTEILNQDTYRYLDTITIPSTAKKWVQDGITGYDYSIGAAHYRVILSEVPLSDLSKYGPFIYLGDKLELEKIEKQQTKGGK